MKTATTIQLVLFLINVGLAAYNHNWSAFLGWFCCCILIRPELN